ncbi:MAG: beta-phosphoglucomutase family hydrolase, partial [Lacisediminimonas sp.]|nr:beta-phosphoglucomutase family hydrolase [Lacisediminimonas sp.]
MSDEITAAIFDMDGVITRTAHLHAAAWKETFDDFLRSQSHDGIPPAPFDDQAEYRVYVDGKPRGEGVRSFLAARRIALSVEQQDQLAQRKDMLFERGLREQGVQTFASTLILIKALRERGIKTGVVTSSRHGREILQTAGIAALFDARLDGIDLDQLKLKGKPDPDMFLSMADTLGSAPAHSVVLEDAVAGVQAGRRGKFGLVVGINRGANAPALLQAGADIVVDDLAGLDVDRLQAAWRQRREDIAWRVEAEGFDRARERQMESLFAVGNGYLGVRGALDCPLPESQCDLFIGGVYDSKRPDLPYSELDFFAPERGADPYAELVPLPFPFRVDISVEGAALDFTNGTGRELRRVLDLRAGVLHIDATYETHEGRRTAVRTRRCACLVDRHLLLQEAVVEPQNHWGVVQLTASLDSRELAVHHPHLALLEHVTTDDLELVRYRTRSSGIEICIASRIVRTPQMLRRMVAIHTSRDSADPGAAARTHLESLAWTDFDRLLAGHAQAWGDFWSRADIRVPGRPAIEQALRFGSYHLRLPAGDDPRVSIGARTLTGRAYEGHVFWDAEIFMLPFFLHVEPAQARNLLLYRHHTLDGARRRAQAMGYRGACFAWESTVTGDDVTPSMIVLKSTGREIPIFTGSQQLHVTADIAYAVWRYWEATGDEQFLSGPGADLLFETARFWASRVTRGEQHHHIRGVVGPDEYHHGVNDNAYTNWLVRFNLQRAAWLARRLGRNLGEADEWATLSESLYIPQPDEHGVIEQFEGFFGLEEYPLSKDERFRAPANRLFDWEQTNRIKLIKQADVLMLPLLFPEAFSDEVVAANYAYYEPITDHGSSLSPGVHAAVASRIGRNEDAQRYWQQSLWLDLSDAMDNSMLGVHPAAMAATWQALVFGMLGITFDESGAHADPRASTRIPAQWGSVGVSLAYRGTTHSLVI